MGRGEYGQWFELWETEVPIVKYGATKICVVTAWLVRKTLQRFDAVRSSIALPGPFAQGAILIIHAAVVTPSPSDAHAHEWDLR
jgi:hypothetical protein